MKYESLALNWAFGVLFLLTGLSLLIESPLAGLSLIILSSLLLPPVRKFTYTKTNREIPIKVRAALIVALIIVFGVGVGQQDEKTQKAAVQQAKEQAEKIAQIKQDNIDHFTAHRKQIILSANTALLAKEYQSVISQTSKYLVSGDDELKNINARAKTELEREENKKQEKTKQLLAKLRDVPSSEIRKNKTLYQQLVNLHPNNETYLNKLAAYSKEIEKEKQEKLAAEAREKQFVQQETVTRLFQSDEEPTALDALWTIPGSIFKVGVRNTCLPGTKCMNGYASYVCQTLDEYGFEGEKVWVHVIDYFKLMQDNEWVKLGDMHCP